MRSVPDTMAYWHDTFPDFPYSHQWPYGKFWLPLPHKRAVFMRLDLQAVNTAGKDIFHMFYHAEILGIENKKSLSHFQIPAYILPGVLLHNGIFPSARMRTGSLIGVPACHKVTQKASSGVGNTHSSMDKRLNLHVIRNMCPNFPDFLQRKFSCTYHTFLLPDYTRNGMSHNWYCSPVY